MAKSDIPSFSATPSSNTDIDGVGLADADNAKNLRDAFQHMMKILRQTNDGTTPLDDDFKVRNAANTTKSARLDASNVPLSTERALDAEALNRNGAPIRTEYTTGGAHNFAASSRYFEIEAVAAGAGGGGVDGQGANTSAVAGGGSSGFYGRTRVLAVPNSRVGTVSIGSAGSGGGGASGQTGDDGGDTSWVDGTNSFTWEGGRGGKGAIATSTGELGNGGAPAPATTGLFGSSDPGKPGNLGSPTSTSQIGGAGGTSPLGSPGTSVEDADGPGDHATGYGAGGSGAQISGTTTNWNGGAGSPGILIVREY